MGFCNVEVGVLIDVCEVLEISAMVHADGLLLEDDDFIECSACEV